MHLHKHVHHFATNLCMRIPYTAAAFPWWSSGPPYSSAAWGQRELWVQLAALAATWRSTPRSAGPNPRKLCQDGSRIKGIGSSAVGSGWHVGSDETMMRLFKPNQYVFDCICMYLYSFAISNWCRALSINSISTMLWSASTSVEGRRCSDPLWWVKGCQG